VWSRSQARNLSRHTLAYIQLVLVPAQRILERILGLLTCNRGIAEITDVEASEGKCFSRPHLILSVKEGWPDSYHREKPFHDHQDQHLYKDCITDFYDKHCVRMRHACPNTISIWHIFGGLWRTSERRNMLQNQLFLG